MNIKACLSHKSDFWKTPITLYKYFINKGFFDPCPVDPLFDGLSIDWKEKNFVNPPYSQLKKWVDKSIQEAKRGKVIIMLIPARTDTKWFRLLYNYGCVFQFIEGRLHFDESKNSAPFPSMLVALTGYLSEIDLVLKEGRFW